MKSTLRLATFFLACALSAVACFASVPVRGSSNNGVDSNAAFWNLMGPTAADVRQNGAVSVEQQIVCTNQTVSAAVDNTDTADAGTCADGDYTFLFQIQTTATSVTVTLSNIVGFTPVVQGTDSSYGIAICDNDPNNPQASNTLQLCSHVAQTDLSNVTATVNKKNNRVTIFVPSMPTFDPGVGNQGQGLTVVVVTSQPGVHAISIPRINVKIN
jgi:hypothetical protein